MAPQRSYDGATGSNQHNVSRDVNSIKAAPNQICPSCHQKIPGPQNYQFLLGEEREDNHFLHDELAEGDWDPS